jgi:hypothetical protein
VAGSQARPEAKEHLTTVDLIAYAEQRRPGCYICAIPERAEIEKAWDHGVRAAAIIDWLINVRGHDADVVPQRKKIEQHWDGNHKANGR